MNISLDYFRIQQAESLWFLSCGTSSVVLNQLISFSSFSQSGVNPGKIFFVCVKAIKEFRQ
jgi:hypothetical protein